MNRASSIQPTFFKLGEYNLLLSIVTLRFINCVKFYFRKRYFPSDSHTNTVISDRFAYPSRWRRKPSVSVVAVFERISVEYTYRIFSLASDQFMVDKSVGFQIKEKINNLYLPSTVFIAQVLVGPSKELEQIFQIEHDIVKIPTGRR